MGDARSVSDAIQPSVLIEVCALPAPAAFSFASSGAITD